VTYLAQVSRNWIPPLADSQPPDHPVLAVFPESEYLKGVICQIE